MKACLENVMGLSLIIQKQPLYLTPSEIDAIGKHSNDVDIIVLDINKALPRLRCAVLVHSCCSLLGVAMALEADWMCV